MIVTGVIDDVVEPFLEVGVGMGWGETDFRSLNDEFREYGVVGRFAGGFDVHIVDGLGLVVSGAYTQPSGELQDLRYYSVTGGLQYEF